MTARAPGRLGRALAAIIGAVLAATPAGAAGQGGAANRPAAARDGGLSFGAAAVKPPPPLVVPAKPATRSNPATSAHPHGASKPPIAKHGAKAKHRKSKSAARSKSRKAKTGAAPTSARRAGQPGSGPTAAIPTGTHRYRSRIPGSEAAGTLTFGGAVARFSGWRGVMKLEAGPVLSAAQGDWLAGMRAYRVMNWAAYRQANPNGPCGSAPVRWIAVRETPAIDPGDPGPDSIDVALLSEGDIHAFRPDNPSLCLFSTFWNADPPASLAGTKNPKLKAASRSKPKAKAKSGAKRKAAAKRGARPRHHAK